MRHEEEQAQLRELSLWMLYVGVVACIVPLPFAPDFFERVLFAPNTYKGALLLFGPWAVVTLIAFVHDRFGRRD